MGNSLNRQAARSYAAALYDLHLPEKDIKTSREMICGSPQLMKVLTCPVVSMTQKMACVDRIFPESIRTFMKVVCKHEKCGLLDMIFECYEDYVNKIKNVLNVVIRCVTPPKPQQLEGIRKYICSRFTVDDARIDIVKDPSLIGGFIIEAGGCEMDYSIRGRFDQLEQRLIRR